MISQKKQEELVKIFEDRFERYNIDLLTYFADTMKKFEGLTAAEAHKLAKILKYKPNYQDFIKELSELCKISEKDVQKVFEKIANDNAGFASVYYKYRGLKAPSYATNKALNSLVNGIAKQTNDTFKNLSKSTAIYLLNGEGNLAPLSIEKAYKEIIDRCVVAVSQGTETYQQVMRKTVKELADSGVRKIYYDNVGKIYNGKLITKPYSQRIDSAVRRNVLDGMRQVSNASNELFAEEYDADGIEVSHHMYSAPDHINTIDGKMFAKGDKDKVVDGIIYKSFDNMNDSLERRVSELNCYHYLFYVILGVSTPSHTEEELERDKQKNLSGFEFEGKKYTMYQGTQLQRRLETEIRKNKDWQILSRQIDDKKSILKAQKNITKLSNKYKHLCETSGLPNFLNRRATVSGYRRVKVD